MNFLCIKIVLNHPLIPVKECNTGRQGIADGFCNVQ
jgi:hypothetical protein